MRIILILWTTALVAQVPGPKAQPIGNTAKTPVTPPALATDEEKTVYALGLTIYQSLATFNLSPAEIQILERGLADAAAGKAALDLNQWAPKIQSFARTRNEAIIEREKTASKTYLDQAAAQTGAVRTESGLIYREVTTGTGAFPKSTDRVKVNYRGTLVNGTEFDSSYARNQPAEFALNGVIPCWTEGLQKMKLGGKSVLVCPSDLAYGDGGQPGIPGGATLTFEVELLGITPSTP